MAELVLARPAVAATTNNPRMILRSMGWVSEVPGWYCPSPSRGRVR
jgi:hypothetical protein